MIEMRSQRNAKFYERQAFKEKGKVPTDSKVITPEVKRACFKMIIELGRQVKLLTSPRLSPRLSSSPSPSKIQQNPTNLSYFNTSFKTSIKI